MKKGPMEISVQEGIPKGELDAAVSDAKKNPRYMSHEAVEVSNGIFTLSIRLKSEVPQQKYLEKEILGSIQRLNRDLRWYRGRHYFTQMGAMFLTAAITVVAGINSKGLSPSTTSNIVLVMGALGTLLTGWGAFFSPKESWVLSTRTLQNLYALQSRMQFAELKPNQVDDDWITAMFDEYITVVALHSKARNNLTKGAR